MEIAALQMHAKLGDRAANFEKTERLLEGVEADIIVLPEYFDIGWCPEGSLDNGEAAEFLSGLAKKLNANIIGGSYIERRGDKLFNTCPVFNRAGELVAKYDKMHIFRAGGEDKYLSPGTNPVMVELNGVKIGLTICYDVRFPEIYRAYMRAGADIITNIAAWGAQKPVPWEVMTRSRAAESQSYVVALTQSGGENLGHSRVIDYKGEILTEIKEGEGIIKAAIDLNEMHEFRRKFCTLTDVKENYEVVCEKIS